MTTQHIEKLKREYTDKYVAVDGDRPELARFKDFVGQVRTVNFSGRALVEFLDFRKDIGWYDIDIDYLKVVDKPEPKAKAPAAKPAKPAAKPAAPAGEKKLSPLEMARAADSKKKDKPAAAAKASTADILAAARGATTAQKEQPKAKPAPAAPKGKLSTADILAAARAGKAGDAAAAKEKPPAEEPVTEEPPAAVAEETAPDVPAEEASSLASSAGPVDKSSMSIDDMMAYCREHDGA